MILQEGFFEPIEEVAFDLPNLPLVRYRLTFRAAEAITLPSFSGPLWSSVLGMHLKERYSDIFTLFHEVEVSPFIIATALHDESQICQKSDLFDIDLTVIGNAVSCSEPVIKCLDLAARTGLGKDKKRGYLIDVATTLHILGDETRPVAKNENSICWPEAECPAIPPMPSAIRVVLLSPLRLKAKGKKEHIISARNFQPYDMFDKLVRRISTLIRSYTPQPLKTDFRYLKKLGQSCRMTDPYLADHELKRWSSRQQKEIPLRGIIGRFTINMQNIAPLWPYLWLGQWTHLGKSASMGLGAYQILPA